MSDTPPVWAQQPEVPVWAQQTSTPPPTVSAAPPQIQGLPRYLGLARNTIVSGLTHLAGAPGDILSMYPSPEPFSLFRPTTWSLPTTADVQNWVAPSGLLNAGGLTPGAGPYPNLERYGTAALGAAASAAPLLASGAGPLAVFGPAVAGGLAGEAAREVAPNVAAGPLVAGALGGGVFQGVQGMLAGNQFENVASVLGASKTPEEAGVALQAAAKQIRQRTVDSPMNVIDQRIGAAAAPLDEGIPPEAPTPGVELANRINAKYIQGGVAKRAIQNFLNSTQKSGGALGQIAQKINTAINDPLEPGAPDLNWSEMRQFRSELGSYMSTARPEDRGALESLYGGTTQDLSSTANDFGLSDAFQHFNQVSTDLHALNDDQLETILSKSEPANAAHYLLSPTITRGGQTLSALRDLGLPIDELTASMLRSNPEKWRTLSPEAKAALVTDPTQRAVLDTATSGAKPSMLSRGIEHLTGMQLGELMGTTAGYLVSHHLGAGPTAAEQLGSSIGGMIGFGAPRLGGMAGRLFTPGMWGAESLGALGGTVPPVNTTSRP